MSATTSGECRSTRLVAHPIGGLGQDNFINYYYKHRHTADEPRWTHSFELRLLAHTGLVGFALMAVFLGAASAAAIKARRKAWPLSRRVAGVALLPFIVWLIHGSVDWFWEMPALAGPALGFLAMATALGPREVPEGRVVGRRSRARVPAFVGTGLGAIAFLAAVVVLALPYLAVREISLASDIRQRDPIAALQHLKTASRLNPLSADAARLAGTIALQSELYTDAQQRFGQAISRDPEGWFAWLGAGLAASGLAENARARHDFKVAASIDARQPAVTQALKLVDTPTPLTPGQAFKLLLTVQ